MSTIEAFLSKLNENSENLDFSETMAVIDENYVFTETQFTNGNQVNDAGQNNGSCKLFAFAKLQELSEAQTLACFGQYYRDDVLGKPDGDDHQNIRNFMKTGWDGVSFSGNALSSK